MVKVTYIEHDGTEHLVDGVTGDSIMETAIANDVPGIDADCRGVLACATCHVYVAKDWLNKLSEIKGGEQEMLEFARDVRDDSRLSCQIKLTEDLDGIIVHTPAEQG